MWRKDNFKHSFSNFGPKGEGDRVKNPFANALSLGSLIEILFIGKLSDKLD